MKIVSPSYKILFMPDPVTILKNIEIAGRTCYKSEERITEESAAGFVDRILKSGHHSVIEHVNLTVRFICDRGVTHELVRHRLASYSQESTRYANYAKEKFGSEITVIKPPFWNEDSAEYQTWLAAMEHAEKAYLNLIEMGARPEQARSVLPNSLKTEIVMTCNVREWRHVFKLRCSKAAHPQIRELLMPLLQDLSEKIPVLFKDILEEIYFSNGDECESCATLKEKIVSIELENRGLREEIESLRPPDGTVRCATCGANVDPNKAHQPYNAIFVCDQCVAISQMHCKIRKR